MIDFDDGMFSVEPNYTTIKLKNGETRKCLRFIACVWSKSMRKLDGRTDLGSKKKDNVMYFNLTPDTINALIMDLQDALKAHYAQGG